MSAAGPEAEVQESCNMRFHSRPQKKLPLPLGKREELVHQRT